MKLSIHQKRKAYEDECDRGMSSWFFPLRVVDTQAHGLENIEDEHAGGRRDEQNASSDALNKNRG